MKKKEERMKTKNIEYRNMKKRGNRVERRIKLEEKIKRKYQSKG